MIGVNPTNDAGVYVLRAWGPATPTKVFEPPNILDFSEKIKSKKEAGSVSESSGLAARLKAQENSVES